MIDYRRVYRGQQEENWCSPAQMQSHCQLKARGILLWVYHGLAGFVAQLPCLRKTIWQPGPMISRSPKFDGKVKQTLWIQFEYIPKDRNYVNGRVASIYLPLTWRVFLRIKKPVVCPELLPAMFHAHVFLFSGTLWLFNIAMENGPVIYRLFSH